ncbi:hypothetical protein SCUCBS95973_009973 [Sporothrix curviconia]|uniref:DNA 3'-5' helicase n=1 Tax=Sporothrix curviconia TaxID=1260050 RepID=A0ABP0CZI4_9PEZI
MDTFLFHTGFQVAICATCQKAVTKTQLQSHVAAHDTKQVYPTDPHTVRAWATAHPTLLPDQKAARPLVATCFANPPPPVPFLAGPYDDGLLCSPCALLVRSVDSIQKHFRTKHGWTNPWSRGRPAKHANGSRDVPWESNVRCQRLWSSGPASSYFPVSAADVATALTQTPLVRPPQEQFLAVVRRRTADKERAPRLIRSAEHDHWEQPDRWLARTGWARFLEGQDAARLYESKLLAAPTPRLQVLWEMVDDLVRAAEALMRRTDNIGALYELARKQAGEQKPAAPFPLARQDATLDKYATTWKQVLSILVRKEGIDPAGVAASRGLLREQDLYDDVEELLDTLPKRPFDDAALYKLACWCLSLLGTPYDDNPFHAPLLAAMAVLAVREDGGFLEPHLYTRNISAVLTVARLFILWTARYEHTLQTNGGDNGGDNDTTIAGVISWDGDTVSYDNVSFSLHTFRVSLQNMITELEKQVAALLFWDSPYETMPSIDLAQIKDDRSIVEAGESFLTHPANARLDATYETLLRRVLASPTHRQTWCRYSDEMYTPDMEIPFHRGALAAYEDAIVAFLRLLLVVAHLTGGQPGRAPEILTVRYLNTAEGGVRNLFLSYGHVVLATWNTKTSQSLAQDKVVYRFLPARVSEVVVRYVAHVVPFVETVREMMLGQLAYDETGVRNPYLWGCLDEQHRARPWPRDRLSRHLRAASALYVGTAFSVAQWRHLAIAITNRYLRTLPADDDRTAQKRKRGGSPYDGRPNDGDANSSDDDDDNNNPYDAQASHSTRTAGLVYGRLTFQGTLGTAHGQERYFRTSTQWHNLLRVGTPGSSRTGGAWAFDDDDATAQQQRLQAVAETSLATGLAMVCGPGAQFRGQQAAVLAHIVQGTSPLLWVAGTGSGKSLAFLLPAAVRPDGMTVVVVPLLVLQSDLVRRCQAASIRCAVWSNTNKTPDATLVFCTPENATNTAFSAFLRRQARLHQLDRIVYDECHAVLESRASFRPAIQLVFRTMLALPVQHVWLTATLPPAEETDFFRRVNVLQATTTLVREPTKRPTLSYAVHILQDADSRDATLRFLLRTARTDRRRAIVFCPAVSMAVEVATMLDAPVFHAKSGTSVDEKEAIVRAWAADEARGPIIATSALGAGLDVPDVALVVHCGMPWSLRDFAQESGRAGRDPDRPARPLLSPQEYIDKARKQQALNAARQDQHNKSRTKEAAALVDLLARYRQRRPSYNERYQTPSYDNIASGVGNPRWCVVEKKTIVVLKTY